MSILQINSGLFSNRVTVKRRTITKDEIGAPIETLSTVYENVPAVIQPANENEITSLSQGNEFSIIRKAYLNFEGVILFRDVIIDDATGEIYNVVGVQRHRAARAGIGGQHYKLFIEIPKAVTS